MTQCCLDNNFAEASKLQIKYLELINALFMDVNPIPVKEAMNIMGFKAGDCRMPLVKMSGEQIEKLKSVMTNVGLVK